MFEAIHGSAPDIAGQGIANPSGLILAGVMMLNHVGQGETAAKVHNAWLRAIEDGIHTGDIAREGPTRERVGTDAFADAVIARLGQLPQRLAQVSYAGDTTVPIPPLPERKPALRELVGVDVFANHSGPIEQLVAGLKQAENRIAELKMITNRGVKVWPHGHEETFCTDHWRCRFEARAGTQMNKAVVLDILQRLNKAGLDFIKTEQLYTFDGEAGYSLGQGQ